MHVQAKFLPPEGAVSMRLFSYINHYLSRASDKRQSNQVLSEKTGPCKLTSLSVTSKRHLNQFMKHENIQPVAVPHKCSKSMKCCCYRRHMSFESAANKQCLEKIQRNNCVLITRFQNIQSIFFYSMCHGLSVQYNAT